MSAWRYGVHEFVPHDDPGLCVGWSIDYPCGTSCIAAKGMKDLRVAVWVSGGREVLGG